MIVRNEADRLVKSLPPLEAFAELCVLDSESTDNSVSLCQAAGASVTIHPWEGFSAARRRVFSSATQPWLLWIDADEILTSEFIAELWHLFRDGEPQHVAYQVNRRVCFEGQWISHGDWFPDWNVRLFRENVWQMPERLLHESLEITGSIGKLNSVIEHHSFRSWDDFHSRSKRYARLWAEEHLRRRNPRFGEAKLRGLWRFFHGYVLKRGFLDGKLGFKIACANGVGVTEKYRALVALKRERNLR